MQNGAQISEGAAPPVDTIANGDRSLQTLLTRQLQEDLGGAGFPNGDRGGTLLCICDFSGAHRSALFNTYAFLSLDFDRCGWWLDGQRAFRRDTLRNGRRLSFKALNDRERRKVLPLFLRAASAIDGALKVVAVAKGVGSIFVQSESTKEKEALLAPWKPNVHEHLLRITHLGALFVAPTTKPRQNVYWIADQDEIASNERQLRALTNLSGRVWAHILKHDLGHIRIGTTWSDDGSLALEDLAAITDFAAGSMCEAISAMVRQGVFPVPGIVNRLPVGLTNKTEFLLQWLSSTDCPLRRTIIAIDEPPNTRRPRLTKLSIQPIPNLIEQLGRGCLA
jgi:hypothetical protein